MKIFLLVMIGILFLGIGTTSNVFADTNYVTLDRTVYPVPFGEINDFEDTLSTTPDGRSFFPLHQSAINAGKLQNSDALATGDLILHIRINEDRFDVSSKIDKISKDINGETVGPLKISSSRGAQTMVLAYAGGNTPNENGLIDVDGDNPDNTRQLGSILEVAPDAGIFELDFVVRYSDGPADAKCPSTKIFKSLSANEIQNSEESRFDLSSHENEDYCIMNGDTLTVEYSRLDESGNILEVLTDSATFDLRDGLLESDKSTYTIGNDVILTLTEPDFDLDNDAAETLNLDLIEWDSDAATITIGNVGGEGAEFDPEPSNFRETGDSTGIFQIVIEIPEKLQDDHLERGEEIVLEYTDWGPSEADFVGQEDKDVNVTLFTSNFGSTIELDKKVYTWTDKVYITVTAKDHNFDGDLIDEIGDSDLYPIKISTNEFDLDNYKLVETGTDTGIFTGEITLSGFSHDADGNATTGIVDEDTGNTEGNDIHPKTSGIGPDDGFLQTNSDDQLLISFEFSEDETVTGSALIQWNEGKTEWLEPSYPTSGTGVVRVIDPDMNLDPEAVDNFDIDVWSDSDAGGIDLTVTETNEATGIFEGTVFFTETDESSGHRLRVAGEDTIVAEYEDNTLPLPYTHADELDITDKAIIQKTPPLPPNKQLMMGTLMQDITCKDNFVNIFKPSGFVACVDSASVKKLMQRGWSLDLILVEFAGKWKNIDSGTNDITNIVISQADSVVTINAWSSCKPDPCNWGESSGTVNGNQIMLTWELDSITHDLVINKIGNKLLVDRTSNNMEPVWTQNKQMYFIPGTLTAGK